MGIPANSLVKEFICQCWRHRKCEWVNSWVGKIPWNRKWQPTLVFLPGKFHDKRGLVGYSPLAELDTTEYTCKLSSMIYWIRKFVNKAKPLFFCCLFFNSLKGSYSLRWPTILWDWIEVTTCLPGNIIGSLTKQESSRKTSIFTLLAMPKPLTVWNTKYSGKLIEMGIPDHLTCLLRNLHAGQEATARTEHGTTNCFQIRKGAHQGCALSPCLFNLQAEYIMWNVRLDKGQAGIKIAGRNSINLRYADDTTLTAEGEEELKSLLMKVKEESEKVGLKHNIQKTKIMASCPITSWQIDGETMEAVTDFLFWAPKSLQMVTAAMKLSDACSLEETLWPT